MTEQDDERMQDLLRQAMPPVAEDVPRRNLWPALHGRMTARPALPHWVDWALACSVLGFAFAFPAAIPILLYCL